MDGLIAWLRRLNRKERFYVVAKALQNSKEFKLHREFRESLSEKIGVKVPKGAFAAMDYHFDWIQGALALAGSGWTPGDQRKSENFPNLTFGNHRQIAGNQEDVDLIIAFDRGPTTHLILVEAKGVGAWDKNQSSSKARRVIELFGNVDEPPRHSSVTAYFILMSPTEVDASSSTMHIKLPLSKDLWQLTRCPPAYDEWFVRKVSPLT